MSVTEHDREYMRRLGRYKAETNLASAQEHLAASPAERLQASLSLSLRYLASARHIDEDDPLALYERARALGLYRP